MNRKIYVRFLPPFNIFTGVEETEIQLTNEITIEEFKSLILSSYPKIKEGNVKKEFIFCIINGEPLKQDQSLKIKPGDEIKVYSPTMAG